MAKIKRGKRSTQKRSKEDYSNRTKEFDVRGDKINDLSWYASKTQELGVAAITNFLVRAGRKSDFGVQGLDYHSFPGIMSIFTTPAFGINRSGVDPANVCAQNLYTYVRSANSGARNYDAIDLFIYYGAVTQLYSWIGYLKRALHALDKYSSENQFIPQALIRAMNLNYDDLRAHQAQLQVYVNNVITRASSLAIPGDIDAIRRAIWLFENVYWDDSSVQSQMYIFNPRTILKYALDGDGAGCLVEIDKVFSPVSGDVYGRKGFTPVIHGINDTGETSDVGDLNWKLHDTGGLTYDNIIGITEELLNAIFYDQDIAIMSGDVLKAYGKERLFKLAPYSLSDTWNPVYDEVALMMIENATLTGPLHEVSLKQDATKKFLIYDPHCELIESGMGAAYMGKRMLNFHKAAPTEGDVIEATRLTVPFEAAEPVVDDPDNPSTILYYAGKISSCGAEIAEFAVMWKFYYSSGPSLGYVNQLLTYTTAINTGGVIDLQQGTVSGNDLTINVDRVMDKVRDCVSGVLNDVYEDAWPVLNLENFKQHPMIFLSLMHSNIEVLFPNSDRKVTPYNPKAEYKYTPVVDADVYSFVDRNWLDDLNRACDQGLYLLKF